MDLILLTAARQPTAEVLPALGLLPHRVTVLPLDAAALVDRPFGDAVLLDARRDLASARSFTRSMAELAEWLADRATAGRQVPSGFPRNNRFVG